MDQNKNKVVKQPIRLQSTLTSISSLQLTKQKTDLLKNSVFHPLSTVSSKSQSSGTLIHVLLDLFDVQTKSFKFEKANLKFCAKEVASVLKMEMKGEGKSIDIGCLQPHEFENWVLEWMDIALDGGPRMNSNVVLSPKELKKVLKDMKFNEDEMNNVRCKKLLLYFLLDQFLFSTSSSTPRSFLWQLVEDLDKIESYNWPQFILDWMHNELARVKYAETDGTSRTFGSPAPLLEAMLYERIPVIQPHRNVDPLNIQKFKGVKKSIEEWLVVLSNLSQSDIVPCSYCDDAASDEALVLADNAASDEVRCGAHDEADDEAKDEAERETLNQICSNLSQLMKTVTAEIEPKPIHSGPSFEDDEDEVVEDEVFVESSRAGSAVEGRPRRTIKPVQPLLHQLSGRKQPKKRTTPKLNK